MSERQIAFLWTPHFATDVACSSTARHGTNRLADRPLVLLDEHGRVLAADASAVRAGVTVGLSDRQAAAYCPSAMLLPAARFPIWEAQEQLLGCVKSYTDRWQPDGLGRVYLDATLGVPSSSKRGVARGQPDRVDDELMKWCQSVTAAVRKLGWQPALGATGSKFGAAVAGQVAWQRATPLLLPVAQRSFLAGQPAAALPLDVDALIHLRHLGIRTLGQYARLPVAGVLTRFGAAGRIAQRWAQGLDDRPVLPPWESAEIATHIEFDAPVTDGERLLNALLRRAERLLNPLRDRLQAVARLLLSITRADGRVIPVSHTFPQPIAATESVRLALADLLTRVAWDGEGAAEMTLTLAGITDAPSRQLTLLDPLDDGRVRLSALLERLATRFGADAFRLASLTDPDHLLLERRAAFQPW